MHLIMLEDALEASMHPCTRISSNASIDTALIAGHGGKQPEFRR